MAIAAVITIVALPFLWTSKRDQPTGPDLAILTPNSDLSSAGQVAASDVAASTPAYLDGSDITAAPAPIVIDVAPPGEEADAVGSATFKQLSSGAESAADPPCWAPGAPFGVRIVVTNTENGFKIYCENVKTNPLPPQFVIVIDSAAFAELADLTEAPIPVELTW